MKAATAGGQPKVDMGVVIVGMTQFSRIVVDQNGSSKCNSPATTFPTLLLRDGGSTEPAQLISQVREWKSPVASTV